MQILWWKIIVFIPKKRGYFIRLFFYTKAAFYEWNWWVFNRNWVSLNIACHWLSSCASDLFVSVRFVLLRRRPWWYWLWYLPLLWQSKILVWSLLTPQPGVLIITNTRKGPNVSVWVETQYHLYKTFLQQIFGKYLRQRLWVTIDKIGAIVCVWEKHKPGMWLCDYVMCGYHNYVSDTCDQHGNPPPPSLPPSLPPPLPEHWGVTTLSGGSGRCGCPGLLYKYTSCLSRWPWHAAQTDTVTCKHANGNSRSVILL